MNDFFTELEVLWRAFRAVEVPEYYLVIGAVVFVLVATLLSEWLAVGAVNITVRLFRLRGKRGPVGRELAEKMFAAEGDGGVPVEESVLDSKFRLAFRDIDYQPNTGALELTADKAKGRSFSSAGLVVLEVGRALQYRRGFPLLFIERVAAPFVNFAGFAWIWPPVVAQLLPVWDLGIFGQEVAPAVPYISALLYTASAGLAGLIGVYVLLKIPIDLNAARRGVSAMKKAR